MRDMTLLPVENRRLSCQICIVAGCLHACACGWHVLAHVHGLMHNALASKSMGTRQKSMGTRQKSMGTRQKSMGTRQKSMGTRQKSMGTRQKSMGTRQKCASPVTQQRQTTEAAAHTGDLLKVIPLLRK
jgi:hypothetical protein